MSLRAGYYFTALSLYLLFPSHNNGVEQPITTQIDIVSVTQYEAYDTLFVAQENGWLGSDAAHSIVLAEDRILWLFGDTFIGTVEGERRYPEGPHINNCIAIEDRSDSSPGDIRYYWGTKDDKPYAFFPPDPDMPGLYFWPTSGLVVKDRLLLFSFAMSANDTTWWLDGTVVAVIENYTESPEQWQTKYYDLKLGDNGFGIHSALYLEGDFIYFVGFNDFEGGRSAILGRADQQSFSNHPDGHLIEYWSQGWFKRGWRTDRKKLIPLFSPGVTETDIQYIQDWKLYAATTYDPMQADLLISFAPELTGPWETPQLIFTNPEHATMTYAARPHPQISNQAGEIIISYVTSPTSLDIPKETMDTYRPRFLQIMLKQK